ncbi:MAG TPA: penicillin-binding transpeptidase domain-containing protein, partial [Candidatus Atribacteria bacterium]|nr:penicillin-binding transpeptidase domain-containing protein [Candidatus Atribacteria bacterium]
AVRAVSMVREGVIDALMKQNGWTGNEGYSRAQNLLLNGGLHIYTTVDPEIQKIVEDTLYNWDNYPKTANPKDSVRRQVIGDMVIELPQPQAAAVVLDHNTGELRAIVGGRIEPQGRRWLNRAGSKAGFPLGSSIKPLGVYASFIEAGYPGGIIIEDVPVPIKGWDDGGDKGYPFNFTAGEFYGPTPVRQAIVQSYNVSSARTLLERVGVEYSANKLKELGITSRLYVDNPMPNNLALGTDTVNMIEAVGAYGALANKGEYRQPISFTKVLDKDGNIILSNNTQRKLTVFKESTAFIITDILQDVVSKGTGTRAAFPNMSIAGKTGTNTSHRGVFFAGYTPYYTAVVGIAVDDYKPLASNSTGGRTAAPLWKAFMEKIHKDLPNKPFYESVPEGVTKATVCALSGKLPNEHCTKLVTEYYPDYAVPTEECDMHQELLICKYSGKLPTPYCPTEHLARKSIVVIPENSPYQLLTDEELAVYVPGAFRKPVNSEMNYYDPSQRDSFCHLHTEEWQAAESQRPALEAEASRLIDQINDNIRRYSSMMTQEELTVLEKAIEAVENALKESKVAPPGDGQPYYTSIPHLQPDLVRDKMNSLVAAYDTVLARIYSGR